MDPWSWSDPVNRLTLTVIGLSIVLFIVVGPLLVWLFFAETAWHVGEPWVSATLILVIFLLSIGGGFLGSRFVRRRPERR